MNIADSGNKTGKKIDVELSYRIVELFSGGLYSSPNKAFEELVTNAYDAGADTVAVGIPVDSAKREHLWVFDNGESMDSDGLRDLWRIGSSRKRDTEAGKKRKQIGKFGIGKLATYILTNKLTYLCRKKNQFLILTMDFGVLDKEAASTQQVSLDERKLSTTEAKSLVSEYTAESGESQIPVDLFAPNAPKSWTLCVMTSLKLRAGEIKLGRLRWVLQTALPLSPGFELFLNSEKLESSKISSKISKKFVIGLNDQVVKRNDNYQAEKDNGTPVVHLPSIRGINGEIVLYADSFATGSKSDNVGRSHGLFLMVRGRLINLDDPLLGMGPFAHGAFNRTRMIVHADGLDEDITSTRESIKDTEAYRELKKYLTSKFNEVHAYYLEGLKTDEHQKDVQYKVSKASYGLTRRPVFVAATRLLSGEVDGTTYIDAPKMNDSVEMENFIDALKEDMNSEEGIIRSFQFNPRSPTLPISRLDLDSRSIEINTLHPYIAYLIEQGTGNELIKISATMEVLLEAQLIEDDVDQEVRRAIIEKRDKTLRSLCSNIPGSAISVAQSVLDAEADETGLEDAIVAAFNTIGFNAVNIGGSGKPDGFAVAELHQESKEKKWSYSVTLEAKSTGHKKAKSTNIDLATVKAHRESYCAEYAIVVARDFEGSNDDNSKICVNAKNLDVTLIRTKDLARLVYLQGPQRVNLLDIKKLFSCRTPNEATKWVDELASKPVQKAPYSELIEAAWKLGKADSEPPIIQVIRVTSDGLKKYSVHDLREMVRAISQYIPEYVSLDEDTVTVKQNPSIIMKELKKIYVPAAYKDFYQF